MKDPVFKKMGRNLRTVFEVVLWHSDTCTNIYKHKKKIKEEKREKKKKKHNSVSICVLILLKVYILFEFKSVVLPLMTQFSNVYF